VLGCNSIALYMSGLRWLSTPHISEGMREVRTGRSEAARTRSGQRRTADQTHITQRLIYTSYTYEAEVDYYCIPTSLATV
jgi:hypothetical protein